MPETPGPHTCTICEYDFTKHLADGSVWCPSCGAIVEPDTWRQDFPGLAEDMGV